MYNYKTNNYDYNTKIMTEKEIKQVHYLFSTQRPITVIPFPPEQLEQAQELREQLNKMQKEEFWHIEK